MFIHSPFAGAPASGWSCTRCWGEEASKTPCLSSHSSQSRGGTGAGREPWRPWGAGSQEHPHRSLGAGQPQARTELPQPRVWRLQNGANCTFPWLSWGATQAWGAPGTLLCHCGLGRIAQLHRVSVSLSAKWEEPGSPPHRTGVSVRGDDACRMLRAGARLLESVPGTRRRSSGEVCSGKVSWGWGMTAECEGEK